MLNLNDLLFMPNPNLDNEGGILIAFGIDNEIVYVMSTYVSFYELITSGYSVVDSEDPDKFILNFKDGETVIESLECSELMHALLRSDPVIIEIVRQPNPPRESLGDLAHVTVGWIYDDNHNITPPPGWSAPVVQVLTEEQKQKIREMGHSI